MNGKKRVRIKELIEAIDEAAIFGLEYGKTMRVCVDSTGRLTFKSENAPQIDSTETVVDGITHATDSDTVVEGMMEELRTRFEVVP
jgi:hypothetical protein